MDSDPKTKLDAELERFISVVIKVTFLASSKDWDSEVASLFTQLFSLYIPGRINTRRIYDLVEQIHSCKPKMEFLSLAKLIRSLLHGEGLGSEWNLELSLFTQIIPLVTSMYLDMQQPKPESEFISLINQIISLFNSKPDSESELVTLITKLMYLNNISVESELPSLIAQLASLKPEPELTSLIKRIISRFKSMNWEKRPLIAIRPQFTLEFEKGRFHLMSEYEHPWRTNKDEMCPTNWITFYSFNGKDYFHCEYCNGESHVEEYDEASVEVKHSLHPKHSLQLGYRRGTRTRKCYCCDKDLMYIFHYCLVCDYAMNIACVSKPPQALSIDLPKWHEHTLSLFPRHTSLTCDLCALTNTSPFYICPPCDFVVHQSCISLPRVIRICRHSHRISFTASFKQGDWSCGVCRRKIDNRYGGYSCFNGSCSYAAHSKCATQSNVWDGIDLEGVPEETEEDVEPFVRISDGIIQHFSHQHHMRLEESDHRDYNENKLCQACSTPFYFGKFYSCMQCEFILHEDCANLSRKIYHQIHPHKLVLVVGYNRAENWLGSCSSCSRVCTGAFVYKCGKEECRDFKLNVQCATIFEPLAYEGHVHPLFLTSKPGEQRVCSVCRQRRNKVTFNCIEYECRFALCFICATIPKKVRYKHDKHMLTLSYEEETKGTMTNWCESCEEKIEAKRGYYKCDEYCCVTLHIKCLLGNSLYLKPGTSMENRGKKADVLANNQRMSRPFCYDCKERCLEKLVFKCSEFIFCSKDCYIRFTNRDWMKAIGIDI